MNRRQATRSALAGVLLAMLGAAGGCGYSSESLYPTQYKTIAIPAWQRGREVYRREWEFRLTEALKKSVSTYMTGYAVVDTPRAETILTGKIVSIGRQMLSRNPDTGLAREEQITMTVSFEWTDARTGRVINGKKVENFPVSRTRVALHGGNLDSSPVVGTDFFAGEEEVIDEAARLIIEQLRSDWGEK